VPKIATALIVRGDTLWRISEVTYGAGISYGVIYKANQEQIRNPHLIYPGQIFVLPPQ
jgi:nucleoid-associated protein YgaU